MEQDNTKNGIELDLGEVIPFLISKSVIIILFALFVGMITLAVTKIFITPTYTASTQILVLNEKGDSNSTNVDVNTLQSSTYLVQDFTVLVKSKPVLQQVKADMDLDISISDLSDKISVVIPDNTRIITIQVEDSNPLVAKQLADCVRNAAIKHIQELLGADTVKKVDGENGADIPKHSMKPNVKKNVIIACLLGGIIAVIISLIGFISDDTIKSQEDVEKRLGVSVLGIIPENDRIAMDK